MTKNHPCDCQSNPHHPDCNSLRRAYTTAESTPPEKEPGPRCPKCGSLDFHVLTTYAMCADDNCLYKGATSEFFPPSPQERWVPPYEMKEPHSFVCSKCSANFAAQFAVAFCPNCGTDDFRCACSVCKEKK